MAFANYQYMLPIAQWSNNAAGGSSLSATGAGVYANVGDHQFMYHGGITLDSGTAIRHVLQFIGTTAGSGASPTVFVRLRDVTNAATIAEAQLASPGLGGGVSTTFSNIPSADAALEFQYSLVSPNTLSLWRVYWVMTNVF